MRRSRDRPALPIMNCWRNGYVDPLESQLSGLFFGVIQRNPTRDSFPAGNVPRPDAQLIFAWVHRPGKRRSDWLFWPAVDLRQEGIEAGGGGIEMDPEGAW